MATKFGLGAEIQLPTDLYEYLLLMREQITLDLLQCVSFFGPGRGPQLLQTLFSDFLFFVVLVVIRFSKP